MEITTLINEDLIDLHLRASSQLEVIEHLASLLEKQKCIQSKANFIEGVLEREAEFSTGFGNGFAIPHCKSLTVKNAAIVIGKTETEIDWKSMDEKPVKIIIMLAIPEAEGGTTHLKILSILAGKLMDPDFRDQLENVTEPKEVIELLNEAIVEKAI